MSGGKIPVSDAEWKDNSNLQQTITADLYGCALECGQPDIAVANQTLSWLP